MLNVSKGARSPARLRSDPRGRDGKVYPGLLIFVGATIVSFSGSLALYFVLRGDGTSPRWRQAAPRGRAAGGARPLFVDVAEEAGIRFRHETGSSGKYYYPEVMGAGCAFLDFDGHQVFCYIHQYF